MHTCAAPGCDKQISGYRMCVPHRQRKAKYGDPLAGPPFRKTRGSADPNCCVTDCPKPGKFRGPETHPRICENHRRRWKLYGHPEGVPGTRPPLSLAQRGALANGRVVAQNRPRLAPEVAAQNVRLAQRRWRRSNPEKVKAAKRAWAAGRSPEIRRTQQSVGMESRRNRELIIPRLSAEEAALSAEYEIILRADPCVYCGSTGGTVDHIVSVFDGGNDSVDNLAGACRSCNSSKRNKSLLDFMLWRLDRTHKFKEVM